MENALGMRRGRSCPATGRTGAKAEPGGARPVRETPKLRIWTLGLEESLPDGRSLNQELVRQGMAWHYRRYAPHDSTLSRRESEARAARRGLWSQPNPVPPWEWRSRGPELPGDLVGKVLGNREAGSTMSRGARTRAQSRRQIASPSTRLRRRRKPAIVLGETVTREVVRRGQAAGRV